MNAVRVAMATCLLAVTMALDRMHVTDAWFAAGLMAGGFALSFCMAAVSFVLLERPYFLLRHRVRGHTRYQKPSE